MQIRNRNILALIPVALLPGVMLVANSAYSDWRFYRRFASLRDKSYEYTAPIVGGSSTDASFPVSVIVAGIVIVTWVLVTTFVLIQWVRASRADKLGSDPGAGE